jgi:hypothetical protein
MTCTEALEKPAVGEAVHDHRAPLAATMEHLNHPPTNADHQPEGP